MPRSRADELAIGAAAVAFGLFLLAFAWYVMIR